MKHILLIGLIAAACAQTYSGYTVVTRDGNNYAYVGFNNKLYTFNLPSLSLASTYTASPDVIFNNPATASGRVVIMSATFGAFGTYTINTETNTFLYQPNAVQPTAQYPYFDPSTQQTDAQGNVYTYTFDEGVTFITKTSTSGATTKLNLPKVYNNKGAFTLQNNVLYFVATFFVGRGSVDYDYYAIDLSTFTIVDGPVQLPNTGSSGCPVPARNCGVNVLAHLSIVDGVVVYVYTIAPQGQPFKVTIASYKKSCGISSNSFTDISDPSTSGTGNCQNNSGDNSDPESTCLPNGCAGGAKCCAGQCYSVGQFACLTRTDGTKQLCPLGMNVCGSSCYMSNTYSCNNGMLGPHF